MSQCGIRIIHDPRSIEYILDSSHTVMQTESKVVQSISNEAVLIGVKALHNGCEKLIYDITGLYPLGNVISGISGGKLSGIASKIQNIANEVNNNGFLQAEHLEWDMDRIYVDDRHEKIYMIYLPVELEECEPWELSMKKLLEAFPSNIASEPLRPAPQAVQPAAEKKSASRSKNKEQSRGLFKKLFGGSSSPKASQAKEVKKEQSGGTVLLDEIFIPSIVLSSTASGHKAEAVVDKDEFIIGKNPEATDFTVDFSKAVSNRHCVITCKNGICCIEDLKSTNGTFINGVRIPPNEKKQIKAGDKVRLANCEFIVKAV